ncbi:MAG: 23S rRNA (uracil(1939)-C(5))-methyltransferase RlmD [Pseudanabaenaceae cyanobacterium bins.68]|nr:23S rRNA (uracil(1939)-C(5))-methyltransferase RlmD [Pseudanabaenaceae cyanobacterium bins.68]
MPEIVELEISDFAENGDGIGRTEGNSEGLAEGLVVFVPNGVPGDRLQVKIIHQKSNLAHGEILKVLRPSSDRVRPSCIVADKCGGCSWQAVSYGRQVRLKHNQVSQALERLGGFEPELIQDTMVLIQAAEQGFGYRNKVSYPLQAGREQVKAGYYQRRSHRLINLNQCPVQDQHFDRFLAEIKQDLQRWSIYEEKTHRGALRHLCLRRGRRTGQVLLTLVTRYWDLVGIEEQAQTWLGYYSNLVGVVLNLNPSRTNVILGKESKCIGGQDFVEEIFLGLKFRLRSETFFQVYTEQAELLVERLIRWLNLQGDELVLDAYGGIGTMTLPLAQRVKRVVAIESQPEAVAQAQLNAELNGITNVECLTGKVEQLLPGINQPVDVIVLDPPRKGCEPEVLAELRRLRPRKLVYVSCNPATLARDLKLLCADQLFQLERWQPFDFFPQTVHVETLVLLSSQAAIA